MRAMVPDGGWAERVAVPPAGLAVLPDDVSEVEQAGGPFDVKFESVGGASLPAAWRRLTTRGLLVWFGQASRSDTTDGADLTTLIRLVSRGQLHPEIGRVSDWRRTPDMLQSLVTRQVRGKAILEVTP